MTLRRNIGAVGGAGLALALGGCGGSEAKPAAAPPPRSDEPQQRRLRIINVAIRDDGFAPRLVPLRVGVVVRWTNHDDRVHSVRSVKGSVQKFGSGPLKPGDTFRITTHERARIEYRSTAPGDGKRYRGVIEAH